MLEAGAAIVAAAAVFVGAATLLGVFGEGRSRRVASRAEALERRIRDDDGTALSILKEDPVSGRRPVTGLIARWRWATRRAALLDAADVPLKVSECLLVQALLFVALFGLAGLVSGIWLIGLAFGAAGVVAFELWIRSRAKRRLQSFNRQLPMALQIMSTSLRSGFGIMEAVQAVAREMDRPLSDEFRRIIDDARVGGSFESSLGRMVERVQSTDLQIVARAIEIHRRVGGDLGAILENVAATMREREALRGHVLALTAQQRFGGIIVGLLPIWVLGFFALADPDFIAPLWERGSGQLLLALGVVMECTALVVMRKVLDVEV